ncbi:MAG: hypothetical protein JWO91_1181 [Acidobacteriaceae bacterium]|nr:hypothetical protein [Acidobacteriaceae bacterium]
MLKNVLCRFSFLPQNELCEDVPHGEVVMRVATTIFFAVACGLSAIAQDSTPVQPQQQVQPEDATARSAIRDLCEALHSP